MKTESRLSLIGTLVLNLEDTVVLTVQCFTENYQCGAGPAGEFHQSLGNELVTRFLEKTATVRGVMAGYQNTWTGWDGRRYHYLN